jgi:hypothetical protein
MSDHRVHSADTNYTVSPNDIGALIFVAVCIVVGLFLVKRRGEQRKSHLDWRKSFDLWRETDALKERLNQSRGIECDVENPLYSDSLYANRSPITNKITTSSGATVNVLRFDPEDSSPPIQEGSKDSWQPDVDSCACAICKSNFTIIHRRHHCRVCGFLICKNCSRKKEVSLKGSSKATKLQRVCIDCAEPCHEPMNWDSQAEAQRNARSTDTLDAIDPVKKAEDFLQEHLLATTAPAVTQEQTDHNEILKSFQSLQNETSL